MVIPKHNPIMRTFPVDNLGEVHSVLSSLRSELRGIIEGLRPAVKRPTDLQRLLGIDKSLSWSVYEAVNSKAAGALATHLPGPRAMSSFFEAARDVGAPEASVQRAQESFAQLEALIGRHADDREALGLLISDFDTGPDSVASTIDARNKRAAFRANSLLIGRQAAATVTCHIEHPSSTPGLVDRVAITGLHNVRRTRRSSPLCLEQKYRRVAGPGEPSGPAAIEPLDPRETEPAGMSLMRDFCSCPLTVKRVSAPGADRAVLELSEQGLGASAEVTFFVGRIFRAVATPPNFVPGDDLNIVQLVQTPSVLYSIDIFLHKTLWDDRLPEVSTYLMRADGGFDFREQERLPFLEHSELLGWGIECARTSTLPKHVDLLKYAFERTGWDPAEFRGFRVQVEHPLLLSRIRTRFRKK